MAAAAAASQQQQLQQQQLQQQQLQQQQQRQQQQQQASSSVSWVAFDESPQGGASNNTAAFATPGGTAVQNQSFGSTQGDPFANDPFFSSSTPAMAPAGAQNTEDKFAVFQNLTTSSANTTNPFGDSSVFGTPSAMSATESTSLADSTFNNAFDAPTQGLAPGVVARTYQEPRTEKRDDIFGDLVLFGAEVQPPAEEEEDGVVLNLGRGGGTENKDFIIPDAVPQQEAEPVKKPPAGAVAVLPAVPVSQPVLAPVQPVPAAAINLQPPAAAAINHQPPPAADPFVVDPSIIQPSQTTPTAVDLFAMGNTSTTQTATAPVSVNRHPPVSSNFVASVADPFDTSSVFLPPKRGPFDTSELLPQAVDTPASASLFNDSSFTSPELPSPDVPPPPLPQVADVEVPFLPPRPGTSNSISSIGTPPLRRQHTIDVCLSDSPPPPPPPRPSTSTGERAPPTPPIRRQMTVDATMDLPALPPRPRPGGRRITAPMIRADSVPNPLPRSSARPHSSSVASTDEWKVSPQLHSKRSSNTTDPFAVTLPHGKSKAGKEASERGIIARPRPRPRPHTPGSSSSPLTARSYSPHASDSRHSESPRGSLHEVDMTDRSDLSKSPCSVGKSTWDRSGTPSSVKSDIVPDPFSNVDPFGKDPFKDQPDPFGLESPSSDPFSTDFRQEQVFHTQAVTAQADPFTNDPFGQDPFMTGQSSIQTLSNASSPGRGHLSRVTQQESESHKLSSSLGSLQVKTELQTAKREPAEVDNFLGGFIQNQFQTFSSGASNSSSSRTTVNHVTVFNQSEDDFGAANQNSVNWKDGDSSSNSEMGDAFSVESSSGGGGLPNGVSSNKQQPKPFAQAFQSNNQVL